MCLRCFWFNLGVAAVLPRGIIPQNYVGVEALIIHIIRFIQSKTGMLSMTQAEVLNI